MGWMGRREDSFGHSGKLLCKTRGEIACRSVARPGARGSAAFWLGMCAACWLAVLGAAPVGVQARELAAGQPPAPAVVINEVLYDPPGKDAGLEFVELFNATGTTVVLAGWKLETGNGSSEDKWTLEWSGSGADTLGPGRFFLIGEDLVSPKPDFTTDLDLQNGPDACRLLSPDGASDVVGWGEHTYPAYYEGSPVACPASGSSIGRDPDGTDTDWNATDFKAFAEPSPGTFNRAPCDLAVVKAGLSRHTPGRGATIDLVCTVCNLGTAVCCDGGEIRATVGAASGLLVISPLGAGDSTKAVVSVPNPGAGLHTVGVVVECATDGRHTNDSLVTSLVLPPPPIVINEVMFKPTGKACEWIELANRSAGPLDIADWTLEDSGGKPRKIVDHSLTIDPGGFLVLVEDPDAFTATYGDTVASPSLRPAGGWPTLNDVDGQLGFADAVAIRDGFGTAVDSVAYGEAWSRPGFSIERISADEPSTDPANWSPHYGGAGGSPGSMNSVSFFFPEGQRMLGLNPSTFSPNNDGRDDLVGISVRLPGAGQVRLAIYDVAGRLVRRLVDGDPVEAARVTFWDGSDDRGKALPTGIYIVAASARLASGNRTISAKGVVVLVRR
jgi:Lamin Tail Domain/FlgD Ig-like domain